MAQASPVRFTARPPTRRPHFCNSEMIQPPSASPLVQVVQYDAPILCASSSLETRMYLRGKRVGALSFILHQTPQNQPDLDDELPLHILNAGSLVSASHCVLDLGVLGVYQA